MDYRWWARSLVCAALACLLAALSSAETVIVEAKIAEVRDHGYTLSVGADAVPVEDGFSTKYWRDKMPAKRDSFKVGEAVTVRMKTDASPVQLREMSDRSTWKWLEHIRKDTIPVVVKGADPKTLTVALEDGSSFQYRVTSKTEVTVKGVRVGATELKPGQRLYAKARTLPSLETFLAKASDAQIVATKKTAKGKKAKAHKLAASGGLKGGVIGPANAFSMFDMMVDGVPLHITFTPRTVFRLDGRPVTARDVIAGQQAEVFYSRDRFGRIIASKVELFSKR